jgi:hypothetical protein
LTPPKSNVDVVSVELKSPVSSHNNNPTNVVVTPRDPPHAL